MNKLIQTTKYIYWLEKKAFKQAKDSLERSAIKVVSSKLTPCQALRASEDKAVYASPAVWSRICVRQGSWYRDSDRADKYLLVCDQKLPEYFSAFLDSEISETDFMPETLPSEQELASLEALGTYQESKPEEWELKGIKDAVMFKILFTLTRFWGFGENLKKYWLSHKANHANFLTHKFTTEIDGKPVPYSVAENAGICSSCVEMFNIIDSKSRKLVRACPGAVTFGGVKRNIYLDIKPVST